MESVDRTEKDIQIQLQSGDSILCSDINGLRIPSSIILRMKKEKKQSSCSSEPKSSILKKKWSAIMRKESITIQTKTCKICEDLFEIEQLNSIGQCQHKFCKNCLVNYSIFKINTFSAVYCPQEICKQALKINSIIYNLLQKKEKDKFKKISQYESVRQSKQYRLCPNELCQGVIKSESVDSKPIKCEKCLTSFCPICYLKEHHGTCDKYQLLFYQAGLQYRQCRKCRKVVEKIAGCNHIRCLCGFQFCYTCGKQWTPNHLCIKSPDICFNVPFFRVAFKIIFILFFAVIVYPLLMIYFLLQFAAIMFLSIFVGIIVEPFLIIGDICEYNVLLGIGSIFIFPILMIIGVFKAAYELITMQFPEVFAKQRFCSLCILLSQFKDEQISDTYSTDKNNNNRQTISTSSKNKQQKVLTSKILYESEDKMTTENKIEIKNEKK